MLLFILSAVVIWSKFKEVDHGGRFYASQVFMDGLLVPTLPDLVDFGPQKNTEKDWKERRQDMQFLQLRFKNFCKHSLMGYEHYTQMGVEPPNPLNFKSTLIQMIGFDLAHYAIIISGYGIVLEFINKKNTQTKGPELFWLPFAYIVT